MSKKNRDGNNILKQALLSILIISLFTQYMFWRWFIISELNVSRYINGEFISAEDIKKIVVTDKIVLELVKKVKNRIESSFAL